MSVETICRVCGYNTFPDIFWKENHPSYDICPCCGNESGVNDFNLSNIHEYREKWRSLNYQWWDSDIFPSIDWNPIEQMKSIPPEWL